MIKDKETAYMAAKSLLRHPFAMLGLTDKEAEVCKLVAFGSTQTAAAEALGISRQAVQQRLISACRKLKVNSPTELTAYFISRLAFLFGLEE